MKPIKTALKKLIGTTGYTITKQKRSSQYAEIPLSWNHFIDLYFSLKNRQDFFFVQVGAHDGQFADPLNKYIKKYNLKGIAVEPQPDVFARLQETYKSSPNVTCVNSLISAQAMPFYVVKKEFRNDKNWNLMTGIASFDKNVITKTLKKKIPAGADPENYMETVNLPTISLPDLLKKFNVQKVDFLQIDCEGYDFEILKTLDFNRFKPDIINLESMHFPAETMRACDELLTKNGYKFFREGDNTCAYRAQNT